MVGHQVENRVIIDQGVRTDMTEDIGTRRESVRTEVEVKIKNERIGEVGAERGQVKPGGVEVKTDPRKNEAVAENAAINVAEVKVKNVNEAKVKNADEVEAGKDGEVVVEIEVDFVGLVAVVHVEEVHLQQLHGLVVDLGDPAVALPLIYH